ncbi:Camk protein kinase [Globisporangium polare]
MDEFLYVRTLRGAIYGKVALVQHRQSGKLYAVKMMSLAHMSARQAISGPAVCEDGDAELRNLRRLSGNRVFGSDSGSIAGDDGGLPVSESSWSVHPEWESLKWEPSYQPQSHNNILMLYKDFVDESSNARCLVFDYCPYGELYDQVGSPSGGKSSKAALAGGLEAARGFFRQIARAVRFIHAHNIAHRDISLENVLLDESRQCRLADFGLASEHGASCLGRVGKTFYMAPEVLVCREDEFYDGLKADMWSLGVLLFILVTGAPPFETSGESDARFRVVKHQGVGQLLCIWQMENRVNDELRDLLSRMLIVDPNERISIGQVCSHSWLQESVSNGFEAREAEPEYPEHLVKTQDGHVYVKNGEQCEPEPHEDGLMEKYEPATAAYPATLETTGKSQRTRKRIKISIVPDSAFQYTALSASSPADPGAFGGSRASNAPALAHENSPWGHEAPSGSLFAPHTTPTAGPRARSGGRKVTLRNLRFHSVDGPSSNQMDSDAEDEEDKFGSACTRRRRTSLSVSCSSALLTKSLKIEREDGKCPPKCRFCWSELVEEDTLVDTPNSSNKSLKRTLSGGSGASRNVLCVCEGCFYATPSPLTLAVGGAVAKDAANASVLVLRKAESRTQEV